MLVCWIFIAHLVISGESLRFSKPCPKPKHPSEHSKHKKISKEINYGEPWEGLDLFEGDIMLTDSSGARNVLLKESARWKGEIPLHIDCSDFSLNEVMHIEGAVAEIEEKTCVRFRPCELTDESFIVVKSTYQGCWSSVGHVSGGQTINLQKPKCLRYGTIVHEFLHAIGIGHQQKAPDRDEYIQLNPENIKKGKMHNFQRYDDSEVTSYGLQYDYKSVMHYSTKGFSNNGEPTITLLDENAQIGQRKEMSVFDAIKVSILYECPYVVSPGTNDMTSDFRRNVSHPLF